MKSIIKITFALVLSVVMFGCSGDSPEKAAQAFLDAVNAKDFEKAKTLSTEDSHKMIDLIASFAAAGEEEEAEVKKVVVKKCTVTDDKAVCDYCCDAEGKETQINLKKVDEKWLADMSKETLFGDENPFENVDLQSETEETPAGGPEATEVEGAEPPVEEGEPTETE